MFTRRSANERFQIGNNQYIEAAKDANNLLKELSNAKKNPAYSMFNPDFKDGISQITQNCETKIESVQTLRTEQYKRAITTFEIASGDSLPEMQNLDQIKMLFLHYLENPNSKINHRIISTISDLGIIDSNNAEILRKTNTSLRNSIDLIQINTNRTTVNILEGIINECKENPNARIRFSINPEDLDLPNIPFP